MKFRNIFLGAFIAICLISTTIIYFGIGKTVPLFITSTPLNIEIESTKDSIILSWKNEHTSLHYNVERKIGDKNFEILSENLKEVDSYIDQNLDIFGIYTYRVILVNKWGASKESIEVYAYINKRGASVIKFDTTGIDTDEDGLTDFLETNKYKTDINNPDTDGDGLTDGDEAFKVFTDPTKTDSDGNRLTDDQEDFDKDDLVNIDEIAKGTDPWLEDSDYDEISDSEEIKKYDTNPIKEDTDGDGMLDGNEILYGTNPLIPDTDGNGIIDGDEVVSVTIQTSEIEKGEDTNARVIIDLKGKDANSISISNVGASNPFLQKDTTPGYIDAPFEFSSSESFDSATLQFTFNRRLKRDPEFEPAVYYFNNKTNLLELLPHQKIDMENNMVSVDVSDFSTYILLNKTKVDEFMESEMRKPFEGSFEEMKLAIAFVIDSSGSMEDNDSSGLRWDAAKSLVDAMDTNDQATVIDFDNRATVITPLTSNKEAVKIAINKVDSDGGTNLGDGVEAALGELYDSTADAKYIVLLTDGKGSYNHNLTSKAINQGVTIYTIGLERYIDVDLLTRIAQDTGGKYFQASSANSLFDIYSQTADGIAYAKAQMKMDTDKDGISDYYENNGVKSNTRWIQTDPTNPDTDGDGILDGEELVYVEHNQGRIYYQMISDPTKKDTDSDGIDDKIDPKPLVYSITDRTLALTASLSYENLEGRVGRSVRSVETWEEPELYDFKIVSANNTQSKNFNKHFDGGLGSVSIKIPRHGEKDAVIYGIRGTEPRYIEDWATNAALGIGLNPKQSKYALDEYIELTKRYPNTDIYVTGHSLGGRLVQDVLFKVYNKNDGFWGFNKKDILLPIHSATFNALGYNASEYNWKDLFHQKKLDTIGNKLYNYYYKNDLVGEGLGATGVFERIGSDIGPWVAKDEDGKPILSEEIIIRSPTKVHGIDLFYKDSLLTYPAIDIW